MERALEIGVDDRGDSATVTIGGEIDHATAPALQRALAGVIGRRPPPTTVRVDLAAVSFLGSAGVTVLTAARLQARAAGSRFSVVASSPQVDRVLEITGLREMLSAS